MVSSPSGSLSYLDFHKALSWDLYFYLTDLYLPSAVSSPMKIFADDDVAGMTEGSATSLKSRSSLLKSSNLKSLELAKLTDFTGKFRKCSRDTHVLHDFTPANTVNRGDKRLTISRTINKLGKISPPAQVFGETEKLIARLIERDVAGTRGRKDLAEFTAPEFTSLGIIHVTTSFIIH